MARGPARRRWYSREKVVELLNTVLEEKPLLPFLVPLLAAAWAIERWIVPFSNWIPLAFAVWATIHYGRFQRKVLVEDLNMKWKQILLNTMPTTPLEPCGWLNKLLMEVWPNYMEPRLSKRFSSIVERRLKHKKPKWIEKIELQEFSLGSCPPIIGERGMHWFTSGDQRVMRTGLDWDTNEMSIMFQAKLATPLMGTARIVINSIRMKGDLRLMPILDGQALLYSFESTPDVKVNVGFGSGSSQTLPATDIPGVSSWLVKLLTETIAKTMVEPRRACYSLPSIDLRKKAVGGVFAVTVISASKLSRNSTSNNNSGIRQNSKNGNSVGNYGSKPLQTFVEVEIGDLSRRTKVSQGSNPIWDTTFNMVLHGENGIVKFHLYEWDPGNVKLNYITSCEVKLKYVADDSTMFWAIGPGSGILAKQAECCGKEIEMTVPFEETNSGELIVRLVFKEWQFSDDPVSGTGSSSSTEPKHSLYNSHHLQIRTGRKLKVTVVEGKNLMPKERSGRSDPYVKLQYGKVLRKTKTISHSSNPEWNQQFEFDEVGGGEYLKLKCCNADKFGDENIGSAQVNMEGLREGSCRDVWVPLEKVNTGELRVQIEVVKTDGNEGLKSRSQGSGNGWIELVLIEARDLIAADLRGTSDPYVRVQYGNTKKRTKVVYKTLNPQWNQTLEFPDNGSPLILHVKDHNALLPTSSIGDCVVEYERLPPNQTADKWIPLQGVKSGEIHVQITRRIPELQQKTSMDSEKNAISKARKISGQFREVIQKLEGLVEEGDLEGLELALSEAESAEDAQEAYMLQLEAEQALLIQKIGELGHELSRTSSTPVRMPF